MKFLLLSSALLLAAWNPALAAPSAPPARPSAPPGFGEVVEVNVVNVDVYVTDKNGRRVTGLKRDDFAVAEDGKTVEVSNFEAVERRAAASAPPPRTPAASPSAGDAPAATAAAAADPATALSLVVFVDNLHLRPENRKRAVEQIRKFLSRNTRPGDRILLATYDLGLRTRQPFTDDAGALDAALRQVESLPSYGQEKDQARRSAFQTMVDLNNLQHCGADMVKPVESYADQTRADGLRTIGALKATVSSLSGIPGRKALLYIGDGISITPGEELFQAAADLCSGAMSITGLAPASELGGRFGDDGSYRPEQAALDAQKYSLAKKFEDLAAHASANRVTFYTLQASGLQGNAAADASADPSERLLQSANVQQIQTSNQRGSLTALAADTGGRAMLDANDFLPELARMQEDFDTYYSLGYTPSHLGDGKDHRVEVKVKRPGLRVRYRQSYRDKPAMEKVADRTLAALFHGIEDNPLDVAVEIGDSGPAEGGPDGGQYAVPVRLKIPLFKLAILNQPDGSYRGKLRILVATRDEVGGTSALRQVEVPLQIPRKEVLSAMGQYYVYTLTLKMKPGAQHVAVTVRDDVAAATSYLSRPVTVGATAAVAKP